MKTKIYSLLTISLLGVALVVGSTSCSHWLEEESFDFIQPGDIPDSDAGATQWVMGAYNELFSEMFTKNEMPWPMEFDCDYLTGPDWAFGTFGAGNFQGNSYTVHTWEKLFNLIHRTNFAGENIQKMSNVSARHKLNALGELKALKAWSYFMLVRAYGGLPIRKESVNATGSLNIPRSSIKDTYEYIIELLKDAQTDVYKNTDPEWKKGRFSAGAAAALLAKVYVTMASGSMPAGTVVKVKGGKPWTGEGTNRTYTNPQLISHSKTKLAGYDELGKTPQELFILARDQAKDVMAGLYGAYGLIDYDQLWKKDRNSTEHMWGLTPISRDTKFGQWFSYHYCGIEEAGIVRDGLWYGCRDHWYKMFESKDLRVAKGVSHRWQRSWDMNEGQYYPDTDEMRRKVKGYTDPETGLVVPPAAEFNDGLRYVSKPFDTYFLAYTTKYYDRSDKSAKQSDGGWTFIRYADVVLIYAEAAAEANGVPNNLALDALNSVRTRSNATVKSFAGLDNVSDIIDFRSAILEERAMELVCEGDRRWDLIRWGIYVDVMNAIGGTDEIGIHKTRMDRNTLWPIPISEMNTNKSITTNNPGWN